MPPKAQQRQQQAEQPQPQQQQQPKPIPRWLATTILALITVAAVIAALYFIGESSDDDENSAGGSGEFSSSRDGEAGATSKDSDADSGIFAIPSTCTADDLITTATYLSQNFSKIVERTKESSSAPSVVSITYPTLNTWMERIILGHELNERQRKVRAEMMEQQRQERRRERAAAAGGNNAVADSDDDDGPIDSAKFDELRQITEAAAEEVAKDPKFAGLRPGSDVDRVQNFGYALIRWAKGVKSFVASAEKYCDMETVLSAQYGVVSDQTVRSFIDEKFLPSLHKSYVRLMRFCTSIDDLVNRQRAAEIQDFIEESLEGDFSKKIMALMMPLRDIVLRSVMTLSEIAFAVEREDYHMAFLVHLIRLTDSIVAANTKRLIGTSKVKTNLTSTRGSNSGSNQKNGYFTVSCEHPISRYFCGHFFGTRLVNARGGANYDQEVDNPETNQQYITYQFGLLRSAFLEELIALNHESVPIRVAYAVSLLELQRYESAQKAFQSAQTQLEKVLQQQQQQQPTAVQKLTEIVLSRITSCLLREEMVEYLSQLQLRGGATAGNLRIPMRWSELIVDEERCGSFFAAESGAGGGGAVLPPGTATTMEELFGAAVTMKWPLIDDPQNRAAAKDFVPPGAGGDPAAADAVTASSALRPAVLLIGV